MDLFLLKKIITVIIMPINIVILLLIAALIFKGKNNKASFRCLLFAIITLLLGSLAPISDRFMYVLESQHPVYEKSNKNIDYIIVLGCRHISTQNLPATNELASCSLQRMVEALRIYNLHPEARIITSGYSAADTVSNAEKVKQALVMLGVPEHKVINENFPKDTEEEAQLISPRVQDTNAILVTNADHMPRALGYFNAQGVYPIPAPTGHWVKNINSEKSWAYYIPSSRKLNQTTIAWYESLGLIVQWLKNLFN